MLVRLLHCMRHALIQHIVRTVASTLRIKRTPVPVLHMRLCVSSWKVLLQASRSTRDSSADSEVPASASLQRSQPGSPEQAQRAASAQAQGPSISRPSPARRPSAEQQPVMVPFQGAWPECASPARSGQLPSTAMEPMLAPGKSWQEPGTPSAPGMPSSRTMLYHELDDAPGGDQRGYQQARQGSSQANPLGDSVASLTHSRNAGFAADRRVRSPTREQRGPLGAAHHSMPSTVQEDLPRSSTSALRQPQGPPSRAGSSGLGGRPLLGERSSSGNPFKQPAAAGEESPLAPRRSIGNPFAPPGELDDVLSNPFKNPAYQDVQRSAKV